MNIIAGCSPTYACVLYSRSCLIYLFTLLFSQLNKRTFHLPIIIREMQDIRRYNISVSYIPPCSCTCISLKLKCDHVRPPIESGSFQIYIYTVAHTLRSESARVIVLLLPVVSSLHRYKNSISDLRKGAAAADIKFITSDLQIKGPHSFLNQSSSSHTHTESATIFRVTLRNTHEFTRYALHFPKAQSLRRRRRFTPSTISFP